jgi:hypothetical protein
VALIALAADKGSPGVTTSAIALGAVWPRPVLVAECDLAGGDLVYRLPAEDGGMLNPARGLLSLAATARRGLAPMQIWEHTQRLVGGLDVLVGLASSEQAKGLTWLWGPLGRAFGQLPSADQYSGVDILVDCGRLGAGSPLHELIQHADIVVIFTRPTFEQVAHLRERVSALAAEVGGGSKPALRIAVIADPREFRRSIDEVSRIVANAELPASVLGGFALDPKGAEMLRGQWGGRLDRSLLIRSARKTAADLVSHLATLAPAVDLGAEGQLHTAPPGYPQSPQTAQIPPQPPQPVQQQNQQPHPQESAQAPPAGQPAQPPRQQGKPEGQQPTPPYGLPAHDPSQAPGPAAPTQGARQGGR